MKLLIVTEDNKYLAVGIGNDRPEQIMVVDEKYQQSELLLDEIRQMLEQQRITVNDLEGIMVVNGPGDFSGLRIGVATANALAYGLGIRVVGVEMKSTWRKLAAEEKLEKIDFLKNKFKKSNQLFKKVKEMIPLASQTFSKSYLIYVKGFAPLFLTHGQGSRVWDVDGHQYIDFVNGLLPIVLGYQYPAVDEAIKRQLKKGITFSMASVLEYELARLLIKHIPCAEMVKYGLNGSDATTAR